MTNARYASLRRTGSQVRKTVASNLPFGSAAWAPRREYDVLQSLADSWFVPGPIRCEGPTVVMTYAGVDLVRLARDGWSALDDGQAGESAGARLAICRRLLQAHGELVSKGALMLDPNPANVCAGVDDEGHAVFARIALVDHLNTSTPACPFQSPVFMAIEPAANRYTAPEAKRYIAEMLDLAARQCGFRDFRDVPPDPASGVPDLRPWWDKIDVSSVKPPDADGVSQFAVGTLMTDLLLRDLLGLPNNADLADIARRLRDPDPGLRFASLADALSAFDAAVVRFGTLPSRSLRPLPKALLEIDSDRRDAGGTLLPVLAGPAATATELPAATPAPTPARTWVEKLRTHAQPLFAYARAHATAGMIAAACLIAAVGELAPVLDPQVAAGLGDYLAFERELAAYYADADPLPPAEATRRARALLARVDGCGACRLRLTLAHAQDILTLGGRDGFIVRLRADGTLDADARKRLLIASTRVRALAEAGFGPAREWQNVLQSSSLEPVASNPSQSIQ